MLRWLTAGESHGPALVAVLEGLPAGVLVTTDDVARVMRRVFDAPRALAAVGPFDADEIAG